MLMPLRIDLPAVEPRPLFRVRQQRVRGRHGLEPVLRRGVAGVEVGVVLLGELAIGPADIVLAGVPLHAERRVRIVQAVRLPAFAPQAASGPARGRAVSL